MFPILWCLPVVYRILKFSLKLPQWPVDRYQVSAKISTTKKKNNFQISFGSFEFIRLIEIPLEFSIWLLHRLHCRTRDIYRMDCICMWPHWLHVHLQMPIEYLFGSPTTEMNPLSLLLFTAVFRNLTFVMLLLWWIHRYRPMQTFHRYNWVTSNWSILFRCHRFVVPNSHRILPNS